MTNNINIHFEVVVEGYHQWFNNFNDARDEYYTLKECGFHEAVLCKVVEGKCPTYWNDEYSAFFVVGGIRY
jgi:hypothetical protein